MDPGGSDRQPPRGPSPLAYVGIGFELVVPVLLGVFLGYWLDSRFDTTPWLLVVGALLGIALGFYAFFKAVIPMGRK
jgi:ATP synthase protein I